MWMHERFGGEKVTFRVTVVNLGNLTGSSTAYLPVCGTEGEYANLPASVAPGPRRRADLPVHRGAPGSRRRQPEHHSNVARLGGPNGFIDAPPRDPSRGAAPLYF